MPPRKRKEYISVKLCPICGEVPGRITHDLGRPGGHGYPGHHTYQYSCGYCQLLSGEEHHDIYDSPKDSQNRAKLSWNQKAGEVQQILDRRYTLRKDI